MEVKFQVQNRDDVMEIYVDEKATADDFIAEVRKYCPESIFPRRGVRNVSVTYNSHVLSQSYPLQSIDHDNAVLLVKWEECDAQISRLCERGFPRAMVIEALKAAKNDIRVALMNLQSSFHPKPAPQTVPLFSREDVFFSENSLRDKHKSFSVFPCVSHCILPSDRRENGADKGVPKCQYNYAVCLAKGIGVPIDEKAAAHYFELAANQNLPEAQFDYADCLEYGRGVPIDKAAAAHYCKLAADNGLPKAQHRYAIYLDNGIGVDRNLRAAGEYYKLAADNGIPEAQLDYANYLGGLRFDIIPLWPGTDSPFFKLVRHDGECHAAFMFPTGQWLRIYKAPSIEIQRVLNKSGKVGFKAKVHLARGEHPDKKNALSYTKRAADKGLPRAQFMCAASLLSSDDIDDGDKVVAASYAKAAADSGAPLGQVLYAYCLKLGVGVTTDIELSTHYLKLAADGGFAPAQIAYATCLTEGFGVPLDMKSAIHYYKLSADNGLAEGHEGYAALLEHTGDTSVDKTTIAHHYKQAADHGRPPPSFAILTVLHMVMVYLLTRN